MPLTPEQRDTVASELKRIGSLMNLSEEQKRKLHDFMSEASEKVQEYKQQHPNASPQDLKKKLADNRSIIRQRLAGFLTPEQLNIWDNQVANAKEFLGNSSRHRQARQFELCRSPPRFLDRRAAFRKWSEPASKGHKQFGIPVERTALSVQPALVRTD